MNNSKVTLSTLQKQIINAYQKEFPVCQSPHKVIAQTLKVSESEVLKAIESLNMQGVLSRVGPVFDHKKAGASTLAAIAVPDDNADDIAAIINAFDEVNHNYKREHRYNIWFVVTAEDDDALDDALINIEHATGYRVLVLPMEASYHIDLSFNIDFDQPSFDQINVDNTNFNNVHSATSATKYAETEH